jgi:hypothetical protein
MQKVTDRFIEWKPVGDPKIISSIHTAIGQNWAFCIVDQSNVMNMVKNVSPWTDIFTFAIISIMDSRELIAATMEK